MSVLNSADSMMSTAYTEAQTAGFVLQPSIMIAFQFKLSTGKAANVDKAGQKWRDSSGQVEQAVNELREAIASVTAYDWTADDRTAHEQKVNEICSQMETVQTFLTAVGVALSVFGYALFAYAVFAVTMGTALDVMAVAAAAALAGVITAELYAAFEAAAATCLTITSAATGILAGVASMVAMVMQGGALLDAAVETHQGNTQAFGDLKQAEEVGAAAAAANLLQNGINAGLAYANRSKGLNIPGGLGKSVPISGVDLDADRDKDHTWNVGGGATYSKDGKDYTGAAHVKYGDQGFQGAEVEGTRKDTKTGDSWGGKAGWYEDPKGNDHITAGVNHGHEPPGSTGHKESANADWNVQKHRVDGADVSGGAVSNGSDRVKGGEGFTRDDDGNIVWKKPEVNTPIGDWRNGKYFV